MKKKVGIITFHNSYNCGSMLETYAIHRYLKNRNIDNEIVNFSSEGQKQMYSMYVKNNSFKGIVKNIITWIHRKQLTINQEAYKSFQKEYFTLSGEACSDGSKLTDDNYSIVVAGSDQVWNITIPDYDIAYFLPWVKNARKVAYAPSFGAKNILKYSEKPEVYIECLKGFDALSIRENNGQKWLKDLTEKDAPVLIDPTLLLDSASYEEIVDKEYKTPVNDYIFFYCPSFNTEICKFMQKISKKYNMPVITWNGSKYYLHNIKRFGFELPTKENPSVYLKLIKNARLVFTTSFHGTIFSTIFRKDFYTIKNGEMYGDDDRVITLMNNLGMMERLIPFEFDDNKDYLSKVDYSKYQDKLVPLQEKAKEYIERNIEAIYNETIE